MIQENEIVMLLLGVGVFVFILGNRPQLRWIPSSNLLISGFFSLFVAWVLTVLESFFWNELLNILEHICYAASSILVAIWSWKVFGERKEAN